MRRSLLIAAVFAALASPAPAQTPIPDVTLWQGKRALGDIEKQLSFGVRAPDTEGHQRTIDYIEAELRRLGANPMEQRWTSAVAGQTHTLTNIIAQLAPGNPRRIILGTHYDSIIRAYRDKDHPDAPMPGANNSASGVALLLETARFLKTASPPPVGIDLVFFDGEEGPLSLGAGDPHWQPLGSPHFAQHLDDFYPTAKPEKAVIFDMVCGRNQKLQPEQVSLLYAADDVKKFWSFGRLFAPGFFSSEPTRSPIFDDHIALNEAKIPSFLVIGFDYEPWFNTTEDTLDKCSEPAMNAVGRTLIRYIYVP
jgi:glutaminyl-peptide cyclotransferase